MEVQEDGKTYREHLAAAARRSKEHKRRLDGPALPAAGMYLWEWFLELDERRDFVFVDRVKKPKMIPFSEIGWWAHLTGRSLTSFEVSALLKMDRTWLEGPLTEGKLDERL